jgi:hypothetical protein
MGRKPKANPKRKKCSDCGRNRSLTFFIYGQSRHSSKPRCVRSICINCSNVARGRRKAEIRQRLASLQKKKKCKKCGFSDPRALLFHHVNPQNKKKCVSVLISMGYKEETVLEEVKKCIVLCANCHSILHSKKPSESFKKKKKNT